MSVPLKAVHNVYVGASTGVLKGVQASRDGVSTQNFHNLTALERDCEICSMSWTDTEQRTLLLGLRRQAVKVYDTEQQTFTMCRELRSGSGPLVGLAHCHGAVVTAVESGVVTLWRFNEEERVSIDALADTICADGEQLLCCLRQDPQRPQLVATGGRESDLQLWDLDQPDKPVFRAKNVRPDMVDLRIPIWVTDAVFMNDNRRIATCHRYSHIRLYDVASGQRRPVLSISAANEEPLMCMSVTHQEHQIVVGSGRGRLEVYDLRTGRPVRSLTGMAGGVRDVVCHPRQPLVASVSLDRFFRLHDINTGKLLHKVYLKSQLNCMLMRDSFDLDEESTIEHRVPVIAHPGETQDGVAAADHPAVADDEDDDDIQVVETFLADDTPPPEALPECPKKVRKSKKKRLPKLRVDGSSVEESNQRMGDDWNSSGEDTPKKKPKLPKLVSSSKKKKKKRLSS